MNLNMEVLESSDIENLIKSVDIELMRYDLMTQSRIKELNLKKKLLKEEIASRILLEAFEED